MLATISFQDVSLDVVISRASTISNILIDTNQITTAALYNCTNALILTVSRYPSLSCQSSAPTLIVKALSNVLNKGRLLPNFLLDAVSSTITTLILGCFEQIAIDEKPLLLLLKTFDC
jgi:hypothetical protein